LGAFFKAKILRLRSPLYHERVEGCEQLLHNVLALGAVADFGAQNCQYTTKVDAR
jgi:hypothetical protein